MSREQARRVCEALVTGIDLPEPFDLTEMCARIGAQRGKPVVLMATPMAMGGGLCGLWMSTAKGDYVFYEQDTSPLHQQHIVFHEIGHMLRRHTPTRVLGADIARALAPEVEPAEGQRVLGRDTYSDEDEYEAELIATLLLQRVSGLGEALGVTTTGEDAQDAAARIERALRRPGRR